MSDTIFHATTASPPYAEDIPMGINPRYTPSMVSSSLTPPLPELEKFRDSLIRGMTNKRMSASDVARAVWGTKTTSRGANVARNRDRMTHYLAGKGYPRPETVLKLAEVLDLNPEDLEREMHKANNPITTGLLAPVVLPHHGRPAAPAAAPLSEQGSFGFHVLGPDQVLVSYHKVVDMRLAMRLFDAIRAADPDFMEDPTP